MCVPETHINMEFKNLSKSSDVHKKLPPFKGKCTPNLQSSLTPASSSLGITEARPSRGGVSISQKHTAGSWSVHDASWHVLASASLSHVLGPDGDTTSSTSTPVPLALLRGLCATRLPPSRGSQAFSPAVILPSD